MHIAHDLAKLSQPYLDYIRQLPSKRVLQHGSFWRQQLPV
jgi:hypothetical protein